MELERRRIPCQLFLAKHLQRRQLLLQPQILVAGHIPVVLGALRQLGLDPPVPNDYPECLTPWMHRRIWKSTVRDVVRTLQEGVAAPFFAKPIGRHKRFRGHVFESWDDLRALGGASDQMEVVCSEVVNWKSEYRVYVTQGRIVGLKNYLGDPGAEVDRQQVEHAVATFESSGQATAGYAVDFGVLASGQTALVEVNDGYALGSYGLDPQLYTDLIAARWCELMRARSEDAVT